MDFTCKGNHTVFVFLLLTYSRASAETTQNGAPHGANAADMSPFFTSIFPEFPWPPTGTETPSGLTKNSGHWRAGEPQPGPPLPVLSPPPQRPSPGDSSSGPPGAEPSHLLGNFFTPGAFSQYSWQLLVNWCLKILSNFRETKKGKLALPLRSLGSPGADSLPALFSLLELSLAR